MIYPQLHCGLIRFKKKSWPFSPAAALRCCPWCWNLILFTTTAAFYCFVVKTHLVTPCCSRPLTSRTISEDQSTRPELLAALEPGPNTCTDHGSLLPGTGSSCSTSLANWMGKVEQLLGCDDPSQAGVQAGWKGSYRPRWEHARRLKADRWILHIYQRPLFIWISLVASVSSAGRQVPDSEWLRWCAVMEQSCQVWIHIRYVQIRLCKAT